MSEHSEQLAKATALAYRAGLADGWDARDGARAQYLGPDAGHWDDDCLGWNDCRCASYPNPYRTES